MRQPFSVVIPGSYTYTSGSTSFEVDDVALKASESYVQHPRHKPPRPLFLSPTSYMLRGHYERLAQGSVELTWRRKSTGKIESQSSYSGFISAPIDSENRFNDAHTFIDQPITNLRNAAIIKARLAIKNQNVNLGVAFGEAGETARLIGDTATRLAKCITALRRKKFRQAMDAIGISKRTVLPRKSKAHEAWLELQYGWKPLLQDVYGSAKALAERRGSDWYVRGEGTQVERVSVQKAYEPNSSLAYRSALTTVKGIYAAKCIIYALPENDLLHSFSSLGLTNPFEIAWELVPFSFVVDWFIPVGDFLSSIDALLGMQVTSAITTSFHKAEYRTIGIPGRGGDSYFELETRADWTSRRKDVYVLREVSSEAPWPTFPRIKDGRSYGHMANGLALLGAVFGGGDRRRSIHL